MELISPDFSYLEIGDILQQSPPDPSIVKSHSKSNPKAVQVLFPCQGLSIT